MARKAPKNAVRNVCSRRSLLKMTAAGLLTLSQARGGPIIVAEESAQAGPQWLSDHLGVFPGTIHVGLLRDGSNLALFDCGDAATFAWAKTSRLVVRDVFVTHHHREQVVGFEAAPPESHLVVPEAELKLFASVGDYWSAPGSRWHIYNQHPHHWTLPEPLPVSRTVRPGDTLNWGAAKITVLETPAHTDGALSYCVEVDGLRVIFCGDLLYRAGQLPDLYCLQKGFARGSRQISDYHGYLGARDILKTSLERVINTRPDLLVTAHGGIVEKPVEAIRLLEERLDTLYDNYVSTSALRHYFPELFSEFTGRTDHLPFQPTLDVPGYLRHVGTSWILVSKDKAAFVMDSGSPQVITAVEKMMESGEFHRVEGLWITHYHDDHVDAIPQFVERFRCPCYAVKPVADVVTRPLAWRLPCISPSSVKVDRVLADGESFPWHEFRLTAYDFPGQTLYHGGLLVELASDRLFFAGDSLTPSGIDDYCIQNRNFLHEGTGFKRCLELVARLRPTHVFNCHVDKPFVFPPDSCRKVIQRLEERRRLAAQLLPGRDPHFALDEYWLRCDPYEQRGRAGEQVSVKLVVFNHLAEDANFHLRVVPPKSWRTSPPESAQSSWKNWSQVKVPARMEGTLEVNLTVPSHAAAGRHVLTVDVALPWQTPPGILLSFTEAIVVLD